MVTVGKLAESLVHFPIVHIKPEIQVTFLPLLVSSGPQALLATMSYSDMARPSSVLRQAPVINSNSTLIPLMLTPHAFSKVYLCSPLPYPGSLTCHFKIGEHIRSCQGRQKKLLSKEDSLSWGYVNQTAVQQNVCFSRLGT